ncbi:hypothetical protein [Streptomyces sp. NPDC056194]|uniref:hypothetical protein n=1 Tax=Streptomyces sp. NPDC056194 TaxID=3345744 RepID=UPI0035DAEF36
MQDWRQRRMDRAAEEAEWREAKVKRLAAEEDARARLAKVPSSAEYGRKAASGPQGSGRSGTGGREPLSASSGAVKKPGPAPSPKPAPKDPGKLRSPEPKGKTPDRPKPPDVKTPGGGKPKPPDKPSSGVLAPGKGKGSGALGKGTLERVRDRKAPDTRKGPTDPRKGPEGTRKGPGGKSDPAKPIPSAKPGATGPKALGGTGAAKPGKPSASGSKSPGRPERPKKVPGIKHGTADGYDVHKCRCRRCRKSAHGKYGRNPKKVPGIKHGTAEGYDVHECRCRRCCKAAHGKSPKTGPGATPPTGSTGPGGATGPTGKSGARRMRDRVRDARAGRRDGTRAKSTPPPGGPGAPPPPCGGRRRADEDLHAATAWTKTVITVERVDRPGDARRARPATASVTTGAPSLPRAPHELAGPRPGTTAPKETPPVAASSIRLSAPAGVAAGHLTDVTLDDVLDHLAESKRRCFATYDECAVLADQARKLRRSLEQLADQLTEHHNLIGRLTGAAMSRLAEAMDVVARKAEQMRTESLAAAERVELAHDAMHDAYRPVQDATAAAGLVMPSARIHNDD